MGSSFYQSPTRKLRQGDIAACQFSQLRARSGEPVGPGPAEVANEDLPYLGPYRDYTIALNIPEVGVDVKRVLRVWVGYGLVLHQNCEIEYADKNDSRLLVAPILSQPLWSAGPWELIRNDRLPAYLYLPAMSVEDAAQLEFEGEWPESAVMFASATCLSVGIVKPQRVLALKPAAIPRLQEMMVRYGTVRGWGSQESLDALAGWEITRVEQTQETVPGPSPLAKVFLRKDDETEEISVTWGVRRSGRPVAQ